MSNMEMKSRFFAIELSLLMEEHVSLILAFILGIEKNKSKTLSNKSTALSFKTKIDILTDIKALHREDAKKFEYFAQIRNQFAHNLAADSFERCFEYLDGLDKALFKLYPPDANISKEDNLKSCFASLTDDLMKSLDTLTKEKTGESVQEAQ
jgi:hypothetical protein